MNIDSQHSNLNIFYYTGDFSDFHPGVDDKFYPKDTIYDSANKIYFIISGQHGFILDPDDENKKVVLSAGQMIFIHAGLRHKMFVPEGESFEMYWIRFQLNTFDNNFFDLYNFNTVVNVSDTKYTVSLMKSIISNARSNSLRAQLQSKSEIINLSLMFLDLAGATLKSVETKSISSIAQFIDANINMNFNLDMLADMAHLHPYHFIRRFKAEFGVTPMKYITIKRLDYAQSCLENTEMSIPLIMANAGFSDVSHFSKTFKKYKEMSPSQYRAMVGKSPQIRALGKMPNMANDEIEYHRKRSMEAIENLESSTD